MRRTMSQREARDWKRRALAAESRLRHREGAIFAAYGGDVHLGHLPATEKIMEAVRVAEALGCVTVARRTTRFGGPALEFMAIAQTPPKVAGA
jgi:hypothetical protein